MPRVDALAGRFREFVERGVYIDGDYVEQLEQVVCRRIGMPHAVGCANGTAALTLALKACDIGPGDSVVTVANTYYATARAIHDVGAVPIFADIDPLNAQMDPVAVNAAIRSDTRAILSVHLYGDPAPGMPLRQIADARGLALIEDCAHAFGAGMPGAGYGSMADFACFSFYPTKTLGALGDAGIVTTHDAQAAERMRRLRYFSDTSRTHFDRLAIHAKLDALQAAILLVLMDDLDEWIRSRRQNADYYRMSFKQLGANPTRMLPGVPDAAPYVFPMRVDDRVDFLKFMNGRRIHPGIHYSVNLHTLPEFGSAPLGMLPKTESHNASVISLPVYPSLTSSDRARVAECTLEYFEKQC